MSPTERLRRARTIRRPETTVLYRVLQHHLETWLRNALSEDRIVPRFVERELRAFLDCGILSNGFLRLQPMHGSPGSLTARAGAIGEGCARTREREWKSLCFGVSMT